MKADLAGGLVLLALAAGYFAAAEAIPSSMLDDAFGPRGLPVALAALLALLASVLVIRALVGLRTRRADALANDEEGESDHAAPLRRAFGFILIGIGYLVLLPAVGYPAAIALAIAAVALYEGAPRDWRIPAAAVGGGLGFWLLFNGLLGVAQPTGYLF